MKTYVVFQGVIERVSLPNNEGWGLTFYEQKEKINKLKSKCKTLQVQHITHEVIKYSMEKDELMIVDGEGDAWGHPQAQTLESP